MFDIEEVNKKINVSVGFILAVIFVTYIATTFYLNQTTIETRVDKRYDRQQKLIEHNTHLIEQTMINELHELRKENQELKKMNEELILKLLRE